MYKSNDPDVNNRQVEDFKTEKYSIKFYADLKKMVRRSLQQRLFDEYIETLTDDIDIKTAKDFYDETVDTLWEWWIHTASYLDIARNINGLFAWVGIQCDDEDDELVHDITKFLIEEE